MAQKYRSRSPQPAKAGVDRNGAVRIERSAGAEEFRLAKHGDAKLSPTAREAKALAEVAGRSARSGRHVDLSAVGIATQPGSRADKAVRNARKTEVVRARIDPVVKEEAATVLAAIGMTVSDAFRLMMIRVVSEQALPFEPLVPNEDTVEAMRAARRGELMTVGSTAELLSSLDADD